MKKRELKDFIKLLPRTIILVGAHFSGFDTVGKILSHEKGVEYIPENPKHSFTEIRDMLADPIKQEKQEDGSFKNIYHDFIIAAPHLTHMAHHFHHSLGAIIFLSRDYFQIMEAQKAANWTGEDQQKKNYKVFFPQSDYGKPICMIKKEIFVKYQVPARPNMLFLDYDWFKSHSLWE